MEKPITPQINTFYSRGKTAYENLQWNAVSINQMSYRQLFEKEAENWGVKRKQSLIISGYTKLLSTDKSDKRGSNSRLKLSLEEPIPFFSNSTDVAKNLWKEKHKGNWLKV